MTLSQKLGLFLLACSLCGACMWLLDRRRERRRRDLERVDQNVTEWAQMEHHLNRRARNRLGQFRKSYGKFRVQHNLYDQ